MNAPRVRFRIEDAVAIVEMDDGKVNAIQAEFLGALNVALDEAESKNVRAVILAGRPGCFSAGLDLKTLPGLPRDPLRATLQTFGETIMRLFLFPRPIVAAMTGHAIAGGCVLALCADRRLLARGDFKVGLSEVPLGITLPGYVVDMARMTLPMRRQTEAVLHGRLYVGADAVEVGYADELVDPADAILARARTVANTLSELPPVAYAESKRLLRGRAVAESRNRLLEELDGFMSSLRRD